MSIAEKFHKSFVYSRRMSQLHKHISSIINHFDIKNILDIGAGDGKIDSLLIEDTNANITGIDVLVRPNTYIPVEEYDGLHINKLDNSVDASMMIDVLHHTEHPEKVFKEAVRVSKKYIIIKDHILSSTLSYVKLKMMDYVGNKHYNVNLPYNYMRSKVWIKMIKENNLKIVYLNKNLHLYKGLLHLLFDSNLHFLVVLEKKGG